MKINSERYCREGSHQVLLMRFECLLPARIENHSGAPERLHVIAAEHMPLGATPVAELHRFKTLAEATHHLAQPAFGLKAEGFVGDTDSSGVLAIMPSDAEADSPVLVGFTPQRFAASFCGADLRPWVFENVDWNDLNIGLFVQAECMLRPARTLYQKRMF